MISQCDSLEAAGAIADPGFLCSCRHFNGNARYCATHLKVLIFWKCSWPEDPPCCCALVPVSGKCYSLRTSESFPTFALPVARGTWHVCHTTGTFLIDQALRQHLEVPFAPKEKLDSLHTPLWHLLRLLSMARTTAMPQ